MTETLDISKLTDKQKARLKAIYARELQKLKEVRGDVKAMESELGSDDQIKEWAKDQA